jgi:putative endonuclease
VKLVDTQDLKSCGPQGLCGFNSRLGHKAIQESLFFMPFSVYIIYSPSLQRFYTGTTDDVTKRMDEHNSNKYLDSFTSKGIPWELFFQIECKTSDQAYKLEKFIKKMKSSIFIRRLKNEAEFRAAILKKFE